LKRYAEATLGSGNLRQAVVLPEGEDLDEWLAVNSEYLVATEFGLVLNEHTAVDFFNHLNMLYGTITEFCIPSEVSTNQGKIDVVARWCLKVCSFHRGSALQCVQE
jgi:MOB kinase activator 1